MATAASPHTFPRRYNFGVRVMLEFAGEHKAIKLFLDGHYVRTVLTVHDVALFCKAVGLKFKDDSVD